MLTIILLIIIYQKLIVIIVLNQYYKIFNFKNNINTVACYLQTSGNKMENKYLFHFIGLIIFIL